MINWVRVFREFNVDYIEDGNHVKKGNINVHCPFCSNDTKYFMGVELGSNDWGCWYSKQHRGRSPVRLLMHLLKIPHHKALEIAGLDASYADPDGFQDIAGRLLGRITYQKPVTVAKTLEFYEEFQLIKEGGRFWRYLEGRGFDSIKSLCEDYQLYQAIRGDFKDRIVIPFIVDGEVVSWTGRSINGSTLRYRDLEKDKSVMNPKEILFNQSHVEGGGEFLVLVEGQFDVLKLDFYGREYGVRSVGLSTKTISDSQSYYLSSLSKKFDKVLVILDTAKALDVVESMQLAQELSLLRNIEFRKVPYNYKDCGELPPGRVRAFCRNLLGV